jgi:Icc-related predicted phosphoesterase
LRDRIKEIKPIVHIFGHIHEQNGIYEENDTVYINASVLNDKYMTKYGPIVIDIDEISKKVFNITTFNNK